MRRRNAFGLFLVALLAILVGCTEVTQTIEPSPVDVSITNPGTTTTGPEQPKPGASGTITLEPSSFEVKVGATVNVKVVVRDSNGDEVPSENLSVNIADQTVVQLAEIDGRILQFKGASAGTTSVIVSASGLQTSLVATVVP